MKEEQESGRGALEHKHSVHKSGKLKKLRVWQTSTAVLGVLLIVSIFAGGLGKGSANASVSALSGQEVADNTVKFINENLLQGQAVARLEGVEESNNMYKLNLDIDDQQMEAYVSNDGRLLFTQPVDLTKKPQLQQPPETQAIPANLQKSDKPEVKLFVMSHCPYGTQMEKGMLPVVKELGGKIDFELKFVNYAMHPSKGEVEEQLNQYCIQRDYNDKYLAYLGKFLESGDGLAALSSVGLSEADIGQCVGETDKEFDVIKNLEDKSSWTNGRFPRFMIHDAENKKYKVGGSPTLIINGQKVQSGRDAQSLLDIVCSAFAVKPEECDADMTSFGTPSPGFGFSTQGGSATSAGCGA